MEALALRLEEYERICVITPDQRKLCMHFFLSFSSFLPFCFSLSLFLFLPASPLSLPFSLFSFPFSLSCYICACFIVNESPRRNSTGGGFKTIMKGIGKSNTSRLVEELQRVNDALIAHQNQNAILTKELVKPIF